MRPGHGMPLLVAVSLAAMVVVGVLATRAWPGGPTDLIDRASQTVRSAGRAGVLMMVVVQIVVAASGVLPASLVGLVAGAIYGAWAGFALAAISTLAGAWVSFRLSRSLFRPRIERLIARKPRIANLDQTLARESWRLVCLMRVSPVMPFAATSYALGLSSVSSRDYLVGTLAALPALLGYVCIGALAQAGLDAGSSKTSVIHWTLLGFGILATVVLTLRVGKIVARAIAQPG